MAKSEPTADEIMQADKRLFAATHPKHGDCLCDAWSLKVRQDIDPLWRRADQEPSVEGETLADLVDNRSLPHLADMGIETVDQLKAALEDDYDRVAAVPYIRRGLAKLEA